MASAGPLLSVRDLRVGFVTEGGRVQAVRHATSSLRRHPLLGNGP